MPFRYLGGIEALTAIEAENLVRIVRVCLHRLIATGAIKHVFFLSLGERKYISRSGEEGYSRVERGGWFFSSRNTFLVMKLYTDTIAVTAILEMR